MNKEEVIELLKKVGECAYLEEIGSAEHITNYADFADINHAIACMVGEEYDDTLSKVARCKYCIEVYSHRITNLKAMYKEEEIKEFQTKLKECKTRLKELKAHIEEVNKATIASMDDKTNVYKVKKKFDKDCVVFEPNTLVIIDGLGWHVCCNGAIVLKAKQIKKLTFADYVFPSLENAPIWDIEQDDFDKYFEKV